MVALIQSARDVRIIRVEGSLLAPVSHRLRDEVGTLLDRGARDIVLDLGEVSEVDAAGVGELVHLRNRVVGSYGTFRIMNPTARVRHVLSSLGLLDLLTREYA